MQIERINAILEKIKEYNKIIIFRHKRPDGDAVGSTMGLCTVLRGTYPEKDVRVINCDYSEYLKFLGGEDENNVDDEFYADALGIVIDTATTDRISNQKYSLCRELIKIDHHIPVQSYGTLEWVEEDYSSACEMIAELCYALRDELKLDTKAATFIYTGMVTDSGRFRFRSVSGNTMRLAGMLLDLNVDVDTLYANLYMKEYKMFKFEAYVYEHMQITENGVAYLYVDKEMQERFDLSSEDASASVSYMDSIKDSLIWLAFIENGDGSTRVRLRSRFVTVSPIAERYHGGGHACAAGATVYSREEADALIAEADARLKDYKANNEGWL